MKGRRAGSVVWRVFGGLIKCYPFVITVSAHPRIQADISIYYSFFVGALGQPFTSRCIHEVLSNKLHRSSSVASRMLASIIWERDYSADAHPSTRSLVDTLRSWNTKPGAIPASPLGI